MAITLPVLNSLEGSLRIPIFSQNVQGHAPAEGEPGAPETEPSDPVASENKAGSGLCAPPCSGNSSPRLIGLDQQGNPVESDKFFVYLVNSETNEVKDKIKFDIRVAGRMDFFDLAINKLIKDHGGISAHEKIITTYHSPEELHLQTVWRRL